MFQFLQAHPPVKRLLWPILIGCLLVIMPVGCAAEPAENGASPVIPLTPASTRPALPEAFDEALRQSYQVADPEERLAAVLSATETFLRDAGVQAMDDAGASEYYTELAFSSDRITFSDPAFIRREGDFAVVGLPDGMGIYLFDISRSEQTAILLSRWVIGLVQVEVYWHGDIAGVSYATLGNDGLLRLHFIRVERFEEQWNLIWFSDESPDWWFNAYDARLSITADLALLSVQGKAINTTDVFYEHLPGAVLLREFKIEWVWDGAGYQRRPGGSLEEQARLWQIATPSAYATLVEFIERLHRRDQEGALVLVADDQAFADAIAFGLALPNRRYEIVEHSADQIVIRDLQTTLVVTFLPPRTEETRWLILSVKPYGVDKED